MLNPWARFVFWIIVVIISLLLLSVCSIVSANALDIKDGVVTMSEDDFNKMVEYEQYIEERLREEAEISRQYQHMYGIAKRCVTQAAMHNTSALKCFYPDSGIS